MKSMIARCACFALFAVGSAWGFASLTFAAAPSAVDAFNPLPNGVVYAMAVQPDGKIVVGGDFTRISGKWRNRIARLNFDGSIDPGFDASADRRVESMILQPDGGILIAGRFTTINGEVRNHIARLYADGSIDESFDPGAIGANNDIHAMALRADGKVLIGGAFTMVNGSSRQRLARLRADGSLDGSFHPIANGEVRAIALQADGKVLIAGRFTTVEHVTRAGIARLFFNGSVDFSFNAGVNAPNVTSLAIQPDGKILAGGWFSDVNGVLRKGVARLNPDGSLDSGFDAGSVGGVNALLLQSDGKVLAGGRFSETSSYFGIERFNANGSLDQAFDSTYGDGHQVQSMALQPDGDVLVSGVADATSGTTRIYLTRMSADGSMDASFNPGMRIAADVNTILVQSDGKVVLSGAFNQISGTARIEIARLCADGCLDETFNPAEGVNGTISASAAQPDGKLVIGGNFTMVNGIACKYLARLNADGTLDGSFFADTGEPGYVQHILVQANGKVVIGGVFKAVNGSAQNGIARLNADGSLDTYFKTSLTTGSVVRGMAMQPDGKLIVATKNEIVRLGVDGSIDATFRIRAGVPTNASAVVVQSNGKVVLAGAFGVARTNADGSLDTRFKQAELNQGVNTIAVQRDGKIIVGGQFTTVNGVVMNRIARLNADGSLDASFKPGTGMDQPVTTVALQSDGKVLVGGAFCTVNGKECGHFARLNTNGSLDALSSYTASGSNKSISALAVQEDGKVIIGGAFTSVNGTAQNHIARMDGDDGWVDGGFNVGTGADGSVKALIMQSDGKVLAAGKFTSINGSSLGHIARLNADGSVDAGFNPGSGTDDWVFAMAQQTDGKIVVGGKFLTINGAACNRVARLNIDGSVDPTFQTAIGPNADVNTLAIQPDGKIVIGGKFTSFGLKGRQRIARMNADGTLDASFDPESLNDEVLTILIQPDGKIVIGGEFRDVGSKTRRRIARLNSNGKLDRTFDPGSGANDDVKALALQADGKIRIGGEFDVIDGHRRNHFARLNPDGSLDDTYGTGSGANVEVLALAVQSNGKSLMGGMFSKVGDSTRRNLARLSNPDAALQTLTTESGGRSILWGLGGSYPWPDKVLFESSSDGVSWSPLGWGVAVPGVGYRLSDLLNRLSGRFMIRATGWSSGGEFNASASIHRSAVQYADLIKTTRSAAQNWSYFE